MTGCPREKQSDAATSRRALRAGGVQVLLCRIMAIRHRTPLLALILAPVALWALVLAWEHVLVPLYVSLWRGDVVARPAGEVLPAPILDAMAVAGDRSLPAESRLKAIGVLKVNRRDAAWREQVLSLARDDDPRVIAAALELFIYIDGAPGEDFDRRSLIPQLTSAMSHPDPHVRRAAFGALGREFIHNHRYRGRAADFRPQLEAGAQDPDAMVRINALAAMLRGDPGAAERDAILTRGVNDSDPHVRRVVVSWLGSPKTETRERQALLERALKDPDAGVRQAAAEAGQQWRSRKRGALVELWQQWLAGEYSKVGLTVLTAVTVAAPILIGGVFFLYFMARLLTYVYQRRWRALVVVLVMAAWAAASYGMFLLYFVAAHMRSTDVWHVLQLAGVLWMVVAVYAAAGWSLHYAVRR